MFTIVGDGCSTTSIDSNPYQLFHLWFTRRIILFTISRYVRNMTQCTINDWIEASVFWSYLIALLFNERLPFDWRTPFGYLLAYSSQAAGVFCICYNGTPAVGFMIGSSLLFISFIEDLTTEFQSMSASGPSSNQNGTEVKKNFCNIIQLYSDVKQYDLPLIQSNKLSNFHWFFDTDSSDYSIRFMNFLSSYFLLGLTMCCTLVLLQTEFVELICLN